MKVTLATEYQGNAPDKTIDVTSAEGKRLISVGRARPADSGTPSKAEKDAAKVAEQVAQKSREAAAAAVPAITEVATDATVTRG